MKKFFNPIAKKLEDMVAKVDEKIVEYPAVVGVPATLCSMSAFVASGAVMSAGAVMITGGAGNAMMVGGMGVTLVGLAGIFASSFAMIRTSKVMLDNLIL